MDEADFIPISALQHFAFCPRQCALIHLERVWTDNVHTAEGELMHKKAHGGKAETRGALHIATGLPLRSLVLGIAGQADVVEFQREGTIGRPYPVEYKKGHPHQGCDADLIQLCAQAVCLEEMLDVRIAEGALFYGQPRRRTVVPFTPELRARTAEVAHNVRRLFESGITPQPVQNMAKSRRCATCSLVDWCLPGADGASAYLEAVRTGE